MNHGRRRIGTALGAVVVLLALAAPSRATWSIVMVDTRTGEVAVGSVTCLTGLDLLAIVPVVVVGRGGGAAQAAGDFDGIRRPIIFDGLRRRTPPEEILQMLAGIPGHQQRQYGIVDTLGRAITFTGGQTLPWRGGRTGRSGDLVYAIQGNVLAGNCVVPAIEDAILNTPGDLAAKLMAGHLAARNAGGDGRCSCSPQNPPSCGCPPPNFQKAGHIGFMVAARIGDGDDPLCDRSGCADGDYFMKLNVARQPAGAQDPVLQLQVLFDQWRTSLIGRPDAVQSMAALARTSLPPDTSATVRLTIFPLDWRGMPLEVPLQSVTVTHAPASARITTIGPVADRGDGTFTVDIAFDPATLRGEDALVAGGIDRFRIVLDDGIRPVSLMPDPALSINRRGSPRR